jgi:hypothetical protein
MAVCAVLYCANVGVTRDNVGQWGRTIGGGMPTDSARLRFSEGRAVCYNRRMPPAVADVRSVGMQSDRTVRRSMFGLSSFSKG